MTKQRKINVATKLIQISENLLDPKIYFDSKVRRNDLAGYYKQFLYLGAAFPQVSGNSNIPDKLNKRISSSCPACVSPDNMKIYINSAIRFITTYGEKLKEMIDDIDNQNELSVHDLTPTI